MQVRKAPALVALLFSTALAGCAESAPDVTDDQILSLFSSKSMFDSNDAPKRMAKRTEECARLLADLDKDIYKDAPDEMIAALKIECRKQISERLADKATNPMGLKLEHVEDAVFAERVTTVRNKAENDARLFAEEERKRREVERAQAVADQEKARADQRIDALSEMKAKVASIKDHLPQLLKDKDVACSEFDQAKKTLRARSNRSPILNRVHGSNICQNSYARRAEVRLRKLEEDVARMTADDKSLFTPVMPYLGEADIDRIRSEIESVQKQTKVLNDA